MSFSKIFSNPVNVDEMFLPVLKANNYLPDDKQNEDNHKAIFLLPLDRLLRTQLHQTCISKRTKKMLKVRKHIFELSYSTLHHYNQSQRKPENDNSMLAYIHIFPNRYMLRLTILVKQHYTHVHPMV